MCGYCCDMCKAFAGNIKKKDERNVLSDYWNKYYDMLIVEACCLNSRWNYL